MVKRKKKTKAQIRAERIKNLKKARMVKKRRKKKDIKKWDKNLVKARAALKEKRKLMK